MGAFSQRITSSVSQARANSGGKRDNNPLPHRDMNLIRFSKCIPQSWSRFLAVCSAATFGCGHVMALDSSLNGVYSASGLDTQVIVSGGEARSNLILNQHQQFANNFISTTNGILVGGISITYSFTENNGNSEFRVNYYADGDLVLTFVSKIDVTTLSNTNSEYESRTTWDMTMTSSLLGDLPLSSLTVNERFDFNLSNFTCEYSDGGSATTLQRINSGTGLGQGSPLIPRNVNWRVVTVLVFPIVNPVRPIWLDPPFAGSFQYDVAPGRKERISSVVLPKGFGNKIKVLAKKSAKSTPSLIGTYSSGSKINLLKKPGFKSGAASIIVQGIKPKVDLKKKAPYPLGLTFVGLKESSARVKVTPKQVTK
jgi:hypothetical protein